MNKYAIGFKWAVILGVLADWFYVIPAVSIPNSVIARLGGSPAHMPVWPAFGAMLLVLLELFLFSGACDVMRYQANARFAVGMRLVGALFFLCLYPHAFPALGLWCLCLFAVQAVLLSNASRLGPRARP